MDWITTSGKEEHFCLFCFVLLHFILLLITMYSYIILLLLLGYCYCFLISRGCIGYLWAFSPAPGLFGLFFSLVEDGWRREKRIYAVYDYLDYVEGRFCITGILFFF